MPTDAEIVRDMAANVGVDYYGIAVDPAVLGFDDDEAGLAAVIATLTRAAAAIEQNATLAAENARLRALLKEARGLYGIGRMAQSSGAFPPGPKLRADADALIARIDTALRDGAADE